MKIVRESAKDVLKPKDHNEIRKNFKYIIFWKGVIDNKRSPNSLKYFLNNDFISQRAIEFGYRKVPSIQWEKELIYWLDLLKTAQRDDEVANTLQRIIGWRNINEEAAAMYIIIKNKVNELFKEYNNNFFKKLGKNLVENLSGGAGDKTTVEDVCPKQLEIGIAVEREHASSKEKRTEIALDHLTDNPKYYLQLVEKGIVDEEKAIKVYIKHFGTFKLPKKYKHLA